MRKWFNIKAKKRASLNATMRARKRWAKDRQRRALLDEKDPIQVGGRIVERLVRIIDEHRVIERTFYEHDRECDWRRKRRELFAPVPIPPLPNRDKDL